MNAGERKVIGKGVEALSAAFTKLAALVAQSDTGSICVCAYCDHGACKVKVDIDGGEAPIVTMPGSSADIEAVKAEYDKNIEAAIAEYKAWAADNEPEHKEEDVLPADLPPHLRALLDKLFGADISPDQG